MLFAFGFLGLAFFAVVFAGGLALASRMWAKPLSTFVLVAVLGVLVEVLPMLLLRHAHRGSRGLGLAFVGMAEGRILYVLPLFVFPFAVVRWLFRRGTRPRVA